MKMISRRDFLKASAVVGATAAMTACGGSSSTSTAASSVASSTAASAAATNGSANIGVCIYQFADNFMTLYRADLEGYLKDMGYSVTIMDGKNDQNTQTEQINTFLQQGVDVLVINPVQTTSAQTIVDTVSPSGTPIVFINRQPEDSVLDSYKGKCCYVGADARQSGTYQGELILATDTQGDINGDGKITYIMCKGDPENIDIITKHTAPGKPNNPTKILVKILSPIWNPHIPPTRFIKNIVTPPKTELITSFKIFFIGTINILPKINKKHMHAKYVIIFVSILIPL